MSVRPQSIVCTYHKTGTVLFHSIMTSVAARFGLKTAEYYGPVKRVDSTFDIVSLAHSLVDPDFASRPYRAIRVVRDPRDIWVSSYLYHLRCGEAWCTNTNFDPSPPIAYPQVDYSFQHYPEPWKQKYLAWLGNRSYQQNLRERDRTAGLAFELEGYSGRTLDAIRSWQLPAGRLLRSPPQADQPMQARGGAIHGFPTGVLPGTASKNREPVCDDLMLVQLESLRADFDAALVSIFTHFGFSESECAEAIEVARVHDIARMSDDQVAHNKHIHSRAVSRWREVLSTDEVKSFERRYGDIIVTLGYQLEYSGGNQNDEIPPPAPPFPRGTKLSPPAASCEATGSQARLPSIKLIYCDPALRTHAGHSLTFGKHYQEGFHALGHPMVTLAHRGVDASIGIDMRAFAAFRLCSSIRTSADPLCGPTKSYLDVSQVIAEDLAAVEGISPDDLMVFDASSPAAVTGLTRWMHARGRDCPRVVVTLHNSVGVTGRKGPAGNVEVVPVGPDAALYRLAGLSIPTAVSQRLAFVTTYDCYAAIYPELLRHPVRRVPHPVAAVTQPRIREAGSPVVVGFIGAQQPRKGFGLVPEIVRQLFQTSFPMRVLVQDSFAGMQEPLAALTMLAASDERLTVQTGPVDRQGWQTTLDQCDLLVAPYDQQFFRVNGSGIVTDAIANGIPIVVPAETTLAALLQQYRCAAATFACSTVEAVTQAVEQAVRRCDEHTEAARRGRESWAGTNGPVAAARAVLNCFQELG